MFYTFNNLISAVTDILFITDVTLKKQCILPFNPVTSSSPINYSSTIKWPNDWGQIWLIKQIYHACAQLKTSPMVPAPLIAALHRPTWPDWVDKNHYDRMLVPLWACDCELITGRGDSVGCTVTLPAPPITHSLINKKSPVIRNIPPHLIVKGPLEFLTGIDGDKTHPACVIEANFFGFAIVITRV